MQRLGEQLQRRANVAESQFVESEKETSNAGRQPRGQKRPAVRGELTLLAYSVTGSPLWKTPLPSASGRRERITAVGCRIFQGVGRRHCRVSAPSGAGGGVGGGHKAYRPL
jgi:hypothetical protein